eukprot:CAMPEP_0115017312 /NCGR_PEP_ID=MMETSP0216-20121206/28029_1 /TAXON_ID=223996 /ORGANISM="Protocruzia adherens, Strain Boccale" /LENGTH=175 /DNA_ID=CAMNT_0002388079 /DNA_START=51 /DNA_END=578 /DNA_ORIENTATION=+
MEGSGNQEQQQSIIIYDVDSTIGQPGLPSDHNSFITDHGNGQNTTNPNGTFDLQMVSNLLGAFNTPMPNNSWRNSPVALLQTFAHLNAVLCSFITAVKLVANFMRQNTFMQNLWTETCVKTLENVRALVKLMTNIIELPMRMAHSVTQMRTLGFRRNEEVSSEEESGRLRILYYI